MEKSDLFKNGVITFDRSSRIQMLDMCGITIDEDGFLMFKEEPHQHVIQGGIIHIDEFAGMFRNQEGRFTIVKNDIGSLIKLKDALKGD
jgi:hypothetical protein